MTKYGPDANLEKRDLPSSMRDPVQVSFKGFLLEIEIYFYHPFLGP